MLLGTIGEDVPKGLGAALGPAWEAGLGLAVLVVPAEVLAAAEEGAVAAAEGGAVAAALGLGAEVSTFSGCLGALTAACNHKARECIHALSKFC